MNNDTVPIIIIIPVYNDARFLTEAIASIKAQEYKDLHILVVDDGSYEEIANICDQLRSDIVSVVHKKNGGVSSARNYGIDSIEKINVEKKADAYIAFLDADDFWNANFFSEDVLKLFQEKYDLIGFQSAMCNTKGTRYCTPPRAFK